jgi:hypothetical protein
MKEYNDNDLDNDMGEEYMDEVKEKPFVVTETALKLKTDLLQKDHVKKVQSRLIDDCKGSY